MLNVLSLSLLILRRLEIITMDGPQFEAFLANVTQQFANQGQAAAEAIAAAAG